MQYIVLYDPLVLLPDNKCSDCYSKKAMYYTLVYTFF